MSLAVHYARTLCRMSHGQFISFVDQLSFFAQRSAASGGPGLKLYTWSKGLNYSHFYRAVVRLSVMLVDCIHTAEDTVKLLSWTRIILVFLSPAPVPNSNGNPPSATVLKFVRFEFSKSMKVTSFCDSCRSTWFTERPFQQRIVGELIE